MRFESGGGKGEGRRKARGRNRIEDGVLDFQYWTELGIVVIGYW